MQLQPKPEIAEIPDATIKMPHGAVSDHSVFINLNLNVYPLFCQ
jgi:hypothetical protein